MRTGRQLGATEETCAQAQPPARPRRTPRALHLSGNRLAAPECGERGSRGRYKGRAPRMSTVRGANRGQAGWGPGAGPPDGAAASSSTLTPSRPGARPAPRRLPPAARGPATWTPHGSPGGKRPGRTQSPGDAGAGVKGAGTRAGRWRGPAPGLRSRPGGCPTCGH